MIPNLTKESFWNNIEKKFPDAFKKFSIWIDQYKIDVNWDSIFQLKPGMTETIKYHDLPIEMQLGILGKFMIENTGCVPGTEATRYEQSIAQHLIAVENLFSQIQDGINSGWD